MSKYRSQEGSTSSLNSNRTVSVRSSYFQTVTQISDRSTSLEDDSNLTSGSSSGTSDGKTKVSVSIQGDRNIIGEEDSLHKERKQWVRPPVVGQASSSKDSIAFPVGRSVSSGSEDEFKPRGSQGRHSGDYPNASDVYQNRKDYTIEKSLEGSANQSLPPVVELSDFQRIPTPSSISSITSRPLEWDSGADVGYFQQYGYVSHSDHEFSTLERMALDQGRTKILVRSDPEGTSSTKKPQGNSTVVNMIGVPTFESTPINANIGKNHNSKKKFIPEKSEGNDKPKHSHLFPEVIIENKGNQSDSSSDQIASNRKSNYNDVRKHSPSKKMSSSLENLPDSKFLDSQNATFPRSHSQLNLTDEKSYLMNSHLQKLLNPPQSVSSSSVATVVNGSQQKPSKFVQTSHHKNSIGTQFSIVDPEGKYDSKLHCRRVEQNDSSTLDSIQMSADDRVNSFEYLPGHMYENAQKPEENNHRKKETGVSLRNDIERGVHILEEFLQGSNANNTLKKKELIKHVVKRLIHTDYPEDEESSNNFPRCSTRRSHNRDEIIGESSSENTSASKNKPLSNSTSLSGGSSSLWPSTTESSKSIDSRDIIKPNKKKLDKVTDEDIRKTGADNSSNTKFDWKAPATRAEKVYENRRRGTLKEDHSDEAILHFINSERENQLGWIVKEINHLSNLKTLLEKQEMLRKNLNRLKKVRQRNNKNLESEIKPTIHQARGGYGFRKKQLHASELPRKTVLNSGLKMNHESGNLSEDASWDSHNYEAGTNGKLKKSVSTETRKEDFQGGIRSTAYTISFEPSSQAKKIPNEDLNVKPIIADRQTLAKESRELVRGTYHLPSLQDCLIAKRPDIVSRAEMRRKTVAELAAVRHLREEKRPVVLAAALSSDILTAPPPPPLVKRVVSQKEMRQQTEKKYRQTFEVKKKVSDRKLKETLKTNRLMAEVYNKRLQLLTLKGHTNLSNSIDVISTV